MMPAPAIVAGATRFPTVTPAPAKTVTLPDQPRREALLFLPAQGPVVALALELHGSGLDPARQYRTSRLADRLTPQGFAVLMPQAGHPFQLLPQLSRGYAWNVPGSPLPGQAGAIDDDLDDDDDHMTRLMDACRDRLGLGDVPLFITGYSGGARLASHLLVSGDVTWAAAGLVAGLRAVEPALAAPPPTISFHGLNDAINPFAGGQGARWNAGVDTEAARYAASQGCAAEPSETFVAGARIRVYRTPNGTDTLTTYALSDAAHAWPGTRDKAHLRVFGPAGDGIDASALIADFFQSHTGPSHARSDQPERGRC